ncbi:ABC transporter substrate-binding protein [Ktedonobacteria bacterium brp13]|nr:ABC transporter substrate-binding protein [Ktedonobacteria bacterium brp13]
MPSPSRRSAAFRLPLTCLVVSTILALLLAACGGAATPNTTGSPTTAVKPSVTAPSDLLKSGTLVVGTDPTYVPMEYIDTKTNDYTGFDIDLIRAMAASMGLKVEVDKTSFLTIFDGLNSKRYDIVISSVTINSGRQKSFDFVPYFTAGESLLVNKGNPKNLKSTSDLCGLNVGVQNGTTEQMDLTTASKACQTAGKQAINQTVLQSQTDVIQLLANHRVDATYQDSPVTDYYNKINPGQFEVGGSVVSAAPYGITVRKGDTAMLTAMQQAFQAVRNDGTYDNLFKSYAFSQAAKLQ